MLHLFAALVAASTALLIFAGGLVTSTGSGLSVPDWPNTYGWFMFSFPLEKMVGGIFYEHGHRLIASVVGMLMVILAAWLWRVEERRWVRALGFGALAAVIVQGVLGGITVLWYLPAPISIAHASLAQLVFCLTVTIALVTSPGWRTGYTRQGGTHRDVALERTTLIATLLTYVQVVVGATMRHTGAGLAIPDFPLAFGRLLPPQWNEQIAIHFAHRVGALVVLVVMLLVVHRVLKSHRSERQLVRPAWLLVVLLVAQITLGAYTVLTQKHFIINSLHVVTGACLLVTSLVLTIRARRARFGEGSQPVSEVRAPFEPRSLGARA
jgi:cytochrome c oxidase assembly protein subunit 15